MTQLVPTTTKFDTVRHLLTRSRDQLTQALPKGPLTVERLTRVALTSIRLNPKLLDCDQTSLIASLMECAQLGLVPDGVLGEAYLAPYNSRRGPQAQLLLGYKGLAKLARNSGQVGYIDMRVVYEGDAFDYAYGTERFIKHKPIDVAFDQEQPTRAVTHVYAIVGLLNGGLQFDVMSHGDVQRHRARFSRSSDAWEISWDGMAAKTVLRRTLKLVPASAELQRAIAVDEYREAGVEVDVVPPDPPAPPQGQLDKLSDKLADAAADLAVEATVQRGDGTVVG